MSLGRTNNVASISLFGGLSYDLCEVIGVWVAHGILRILLVTIVYTNSYSLVHLIWGIPRL